MLEMVVVLPVLIVLAIGLYEFGRVFYTSVTVANAARAGAEMGAFSNQSAANITDIQNFASLDGSEVGVVIDSVRNVCQCGGAAAALLLAKAK